MSYIKIKSEKLVQICQDTVQYWEERRKDEYQKLINREMQLLNNERKKKWFGDKTLYTFGQVEKFVVFWEKNDPWYYELSLIERCGKNSENIAKRLLRMAKLADEVTVSADELDQLLT